MATFCNVPISKTLDPQSEHSRVALDWISTSGVQASKSSASGVLSLPCGDVVCSMHMKLSTAASLSSDLVLGRDWLFFFSLSSGIVSPGQQSTAVLPTQPFRNMADMVDVPTQYELSMAEHCPCSYLYQPFDIDVSAMNLRFAVVLLRLDLPHR
ncbi:hypothetical protein GGX14DRAFT_442586 [Mycena pura]|uniref:Uncharacterized protein n=1 Tax=Mycena pura TaxID=153505 RepID=A0AAD6VP78_9AGAR|nr:hypothetical protein GGX14DRAFT_442586 [Mycena pura]